MDEMKMDLKKRTWQRRSQKAGHGSFRGQTSPLKATDGGVLEGGGRCGGPAQAAAPQCVGGAPQKPPLPLPPSHHTQHCNILRYLPTILHHDQHKFFLFKLFYVPNQLPLGCNPNQSALETIRTIIGTSTIWSPPHKTKHPH